MRTTFFPLLPRQPLTSTQLLYRQELACPQEAVPARRRLDLVCEASRGAQAHGRRQGARARDEGGEGGRAPGTTSFPSFPLFFFVSSLLTLPGPHPEDQGAQGGQGGEDPLREDGREDAPQARRAPQAQGEAQQAAPLVIFCSSSISIFLFFSCVLFSLASTFLFYGIQAFMWVPPVVLRMYSIYLGT